MVKVQNHVYLFAMLWAFWLVLWKTWLYILKTSWLFFLNSSKFHRNFEKYRWLVLPQKNKSRDFQALQWRYMILRFCHQNYTLWNASPWHWHEQTSKTGAVTRNTGPYKFWYSVKETNRYKIILNIYQSTKPSIAISCLAAPVLRCSEPGWEGFIIHGESK